MTNIGPLTTVYTPPASCSDSTGWYETYRTTTETDGNITSLYRHFRGPISADECLPPDFTTQRGAYYSPGICPSGYTPACERTTDFANPSVKKVICCPSAVMTFGCANDKDHPDKCVYNATAEHGSLNPLTVIRGGSTYTSSTIKSGGWIYAYGVEIWNTYEATTTTGELTRTEITSTSSSSSLPEGESSNGGLGTGAVAGIAVGATIGGLLIGALLIFLFLRIRSRGKAQVSGSGQMTPAEGFQPEPKDTGAVYYAPVETQPRAEVVSWPSHASWPPPEMSATVQHSHELYSGEGGAGAADGRVNR